MPANNSHHRHIIDIQIATTDDNIPSEEQFLEWVTAATEKYAKPIEVTIRLVGLDESQTLNNQYRNKNKPTNVLSFPAEAHDFLDEVFLGDLVICVPVVEQEAHEQQKAINAHWAHLVIHGLLHLQGYDHIDDHDAELMESTEVKLLTGLGFDNPYEHQ